jgi:hypothetical protein
MRNFLYLCYFLIFLSSCSSENKPLAEGKEAELKNHFLNEYKMIDGSSRVDSFAVLRIDTITEQTRLASLAFDLMGEWQKQNELLEIENQLLQKRIGLMQLTKGQPESAANENEARQSLDTINAIRNRIETAKSKMNYYDSLSKTADSKKAIGYEAICIYRIQKKDWTDQTDTAYIVMDKNKNIVPREKLYYP